MKTIIFIFITFAAIFSGCSSKEVYKPDVVVDDWENVSGSDVTISDISSSAALLEDRRVLVNNQIVDIQIDEENTLLGHSNGWILSATIDGNLTIANVKDKTKIEKFNLKRTIATASINGDILAVLFANNEMALYSIPTKALILKEQGDAPLVVNSKIVQPVFRDDLVIFSTLDGKIVIVQITTKKKLRTVIVGSEKHFNNVIFFELIDGKIVAATGNKILSLSQKETRVSYDIRSVVSDGKNIFVATKQGEIISLNADLNQNAKLKFPFAHFLGMILHKDKLYALEKAGYLIEISKDLTQHGVYEVDLEEGYVHIADKIFYVDDEYISVE